MQSSGNYGGFGQFAAPSNLNSKFTGTGGSN